MNSQCETLEVYFYATNSGNKPVREWLKELPKEDKKTQKTPQKELDIAIKHYKELCKK